MTDRNQQAKDKFLAQQQQVELERVRRTFAAGVATGEITGLDRFGHRLTMGSLALFRPPNDLVFEVTEVKPILDPRAPVGLVQLTLVAKCPVTMKVNEPAGNIVRVGEVAAKAMTDQPDDTPGDSIGIVPEAKVDVRETESSEPRVEADIVRAADELSAEDPPPQTLGDA